MLQFIAQAHARQAPISFVQYWGKGLRSTLAAPEFTCLDYLDSMMSRIVDIYEPGIDFTLVFTDTHAALNGHSQASINSYFHDLVLATRRHRFKTCLLSSLVNTAGLRPDEMPEQRVPPADLLAELRVSAAKWFKGEGSPDDGAIRYFQANMLERKVMERAFPRSIFITFNGSQFRSLFPDGLPIFYMFSLHHGVSDKPWFLPPDYTGPKPRLNEQSSAPFRPVSEFAGRASIMTNYNVLAAGDTALIVDFGNQVDLNVSAKVLALAGRLDALKIDGVIETVPTIRSLSIYYEPLTVSAIGLERQVADILEHLEEIPATGRTCDIPVCYDRELAPDLEQVASQCNLKPAQVVEIHSSRTYHVYMLGFLPGLAYLGDLPPELALPRRTTPRPKIPAGSLGIGGKLTCVYPMATPCGWHLIGRSPVALWDATLTRGALLRAGDKVRFKPVSLREYRRACSDGIVAVPQADTSH